VAPKDWQIVIASHHEGYIGWDEYERNQRQIAHSAAMKGAMVRGPARNGGALLAGLFRCGRCGRKLHVAYSGTEGQCLRYACRGAQTNHGVDHCISFGGLTADRLVVEEVLRRLEPLGIQAALQAIDREFKSGNEKIAQKQLSLEQARFEVTRARRQYDAVDPDNRLVCSELERRWNDALKRYREIEEELNALRASAPQSLSETTRQRILELGRDLPAVWHHPQSPQQLKKRIVRTLLHEIVVRIEAERVLMILHWQGGDHTSLEFIKNQHGRHRYTTPKNVVQLVRELARVQPDRAIVALLNMMRLRTGHGHAWTESRLRVFRHDHEIAAYVEGERVSRGELTLEETAAVLKTSTETVRRLISKQLIAARQACKGAPWIIQRKDIERLAAETGLHTKNIDQLSLKLQ
jgi:hypothetical protein